MKSGKRETTWNISCSISFSSTFPVILYLGNLDYSLDSVLTRDEGDEEAAGGVGEEERQRCTAPPCHHQQGTDDHNTPFVVFRGGIPFISTQLLYLDRNPYTQS